MSILKPTISVSVIALTIALAACAAKPTQVIVSPQVMTAGKAIYQQQWVNVTVEDIRPKQAVVTILREDEPATTYLPSEPLEKVVLNALQGAFKSQGLSINSSAENQVAVVIENAEIVVNQSMMQYEAKNNIVISVQLNNGKQTLTNKFKSRGTSNGPLKADLAVLERDFNNQLGKVIDDAIQSTELQAMIKQ